LVLVCNRSHALVEAVGDVGFNFNFNDVDLRAPKS